MTRTQPAESGRFRRAVLAVITVSLSVAVALAAAEWGLRYLSRHIQTSDRLDPGMIVYDAALGWRLARNWTGAHENFDFRVSYSTDISGFRADSPVTGAPELVALVGDSFTFGLGVDDGETFASYLNRMDPRGRAFKNFGVPGFSTDQEAILIAEIIKRFRPREIWLFAYLPNDLLDNQRAFPLQAENAKPYFELVDGLLAARNTPVPLQRKPAEKRRVSLSAAILGRGAMDDASPAAKFLGRLQLARWLGYQPAQQPRLEESLAERHAEAVRLFRALVRSAAEFCKERGVSLRLVLLPGRSYVERPGSVSARFQEVLREAILARPTGAATTMDLAAGLRMAHRKDGDGWFYPNDGHFTPAGNRKVAQMLLQREGRP